MSVELPHVDRRVSGRVRGRGAGGMMNDYREESLLVGTQGGISR